MIKSKLFIDYHRQYIEVNTADAISHRDITPSASTAGMPAATRSCDAATVQLQPLLHVLPLLTAPASYVIEKYQASLKHNVIPMYLKGTKC